MSKRPVSPKIVDDESSFVLILMKKSGGKIEPFWGESSPSGNHEIISSLEARGGSSLFLGRFAENEVRAVLRKRNFFKEAQKRRLWPLAYELDSCQYPLQRFRLYYREKNSDNLVVDLKIREAPYPLGLRIEGFPAVLTAESLILEWLTLQNPLAVFSVNEAPLPGQDRPGLKLSKKILDLFIYLARLTKKDCLLAFPAYFHNALLFSRYFHFVNPDKESEVLAIRKAFRRIPFKRLAWIIHWGCLKKRDGSAYAWTSEEQIFPLSRMLKEYCRSKEYKDKVTAGLIGQSYTIDQACLKARAGNVPRIAEGEEFVPEDDPEEQ